MHMDDFADQYDQYTAEDPEATHHSKPHTAWFFGATIILKCLVLTRMLTGAGVANMGKVIIQAVDIAMGTKIARKLRFDVCSLSFPIPGLKTMERAKKKLAVLCVHWRRYQCATKDIVSYHVCDSSPQHGYNYFVCRQEDLSFDNYQMRCEPYPLLEVSELWTMPLTVLGTGKATLADKASNYIHMLKITAGSAYDKKKELQ